MSFMEEITLGSTKYFAIYNLILTFAAANVSK